MINIVGFLFISILGAVIHECCRKSKRKNKIMLLFCNVDGCVDDYVRLLIGPYFLWVIIEYFFIGINPNFLTAKLLGLGVGLIVIPSFCYSYRVIFGKAYLVLDVVIYLVSILCAQMFSYEIIIAAAVPGCVNYSSAVLFIALFVAYIGHIIMPINIHELDYSGRTKKIKNKKARK